MTSIPQLRVEQVSLVVKGATGQKAEKLLPTQYLLRGLSFEVFRGDRGVIVGASGSGKTSLFRLLNRLIEPFQGSLYLEEQEFRQIPVVQLRQQITLVSQETKLLGMTVREALLYPLKLRGIPPTIAEPQISEWVERLHIPQEWLDRTEQQLSVGQRQRVAIARALVIRPKILLLDEPTSSLDTGGSHHLIKVLRDVSQTGMTILMATHELELAQQFCESSKTRGRVLYLQQGALIQNSDGDRVDWQALQSEIEQTAAAEAEEWE